jgi:methionine synthase I (cobalamin-dependent)
VGVSHRIDFEKLLADRQVLVADGGMGTSLFALGLANGESPELLNVERPEMVESAHFGFVAAGADVILTNTFGGNRRRLALHRLEDRVAEITDAAVQTARRSAATAGDRRVAVAGSIGPTGDLIAPLGPLSQDDAVAVFAEQAAALVDAEVDVLWIETMSSLEELSAAYTAAVRFDLPVVATMSFDTHGRTMMGVAPSAFSEWSLAQPQRPLGIGGNCGIGPGDVLAAVGDIIDSAPDAVVIAKANAGIPAYTEGGLSYPVAAVDMADYARLALAVGARIIGACCGSTPHHLGEIRTAVDTAAPRSRPEREEIATRFDVSLNEAPRERVRTSRRRSGRRSA